MAERGKRGTSTGKSRSTRSRPSTTSSSGRKTSTRKRSQPAASWPTIAIRPEHQRELFALGLITVALVTTIFFVTGITGGVGNIYLHIVQHGLGSGALIIPLVLGVLGVAILIQEQFHDSRLSGSHFLGTILITATIQMLLEFPLHDIPFETRPDEGGGMVGYYLVQAFDATIGRPAATLVVLMLLLAGIMLTFNITLREGIPAILEWTATLWEMLWSGSRRESERPRWRGEGRRFSEIPPPSPLHLTDASAKEELDDIVPTPIAERPTRASLYRRPTQPNMVAPPAPMHPATPPALLNQPDTLSPKLLVQKPTSSSVSLSSRSLAASSPPSSPPSSSPLQRTLMDQQEEQAVETFDGPTIHRAWPLPSLDLLDPPIAGGITDNERQNRARIIEETLASFKVEAQIIGVHTGPVITQFELQPAVGVKISKITSLEKDLALALAAPSIRIEAPIPGKSAVGIEIPNSAISMVTLREVIDSEQTTNHKGKLKLPMGKDISGTPVISDLTRMPHLLVAGSTGSGKSVAINAFLCGLLLKHTPEELRMILIDPKMVEMIVYNHIPHLLSPVVTELERVVPTLKWATREMERRYKVFARLGCRNLEGYMKQVRTRADLEPMPFILIIIDELADLMMMAPDDVETHICRLAQMARATGIHLVIATQRPSVDVITGLIKANFPSRVAFAVSSQVDSRVILDTPGAERLLGRGDMLYMAADSARLVRMQGTFVSDREVEKIVDFWRKATPPEYRTNPKSQGQESGSKKLPAPTPASPERTASESAPKSSQSSPSASQPPSPSGTSPLASPPAPRPVASPSPTAPPSHRTFMPAGSSLSREEQEELYPQAVDLVRQHRRASASLLQRRLRIGYSKAAQLIDLLEQQGIVGPAEEGRSREVLTE